MKISPARALKGSVTLPGDKSISHRSALLGAMSDGVVEISNYSSSEDCTATLNCLRSLGVEIEASDRMIQVHGVGLDGFAESREPLDCGNSGTTMRLISGLLAGQDLTTTLTGDDSLRRRPMKRIIEPLSKMGAEFLSNEGRAPFTVTGNHPLRAVEIRMEVSSAQVKSAILLAGLNSDGETAVIEPEQTRDHTERMLRWLGADVRSAETAEGMRISVQGGSRLTAKPITVPSDISAAAFFMVAAACLPGSELTFSHVGMNSSRTAVVEVLKRLGVSVEIMKHEERCNEPVADFRVEGGDLPDAGLFKLSGGIIANLIDELPIIAVLGTQLPGGIEVRDASELRHKECDRIAAMAENLTKMGADVTEFDDGFAIRRSSLQGAEVDSFGDHRIAMACSIAALLAEGDSEITNDEAVGVSFPGFFNVLSELTAQ